MRVKGVLGWLAGASMVLVAGCTTYYKVQDPAGDRAYYTTDIDEKRAGSISFKDEKSGSKVTLQSSEVKEISKEEFEAAVKSPAAAPAQPSPQK